MLSKNLSRKLYHGKISHAYPLPDPHDRRIEIIVEEGLFILELIKKEMKNNEQNQD